MQKKQMLYALLLLILFAGCGSNGEEPPKQPEPFVDETVIGTVNSEQNIIAEEPALPDVLEPEASGVAVEENEKAIYHSGSL